MDSGWQDADRMEKLERDVGSITGDQRVPVSLIDIVVERLAIQ